MKEKYMLREESLPLVALRGIWLLPGMTMSFDIGREFTKKALESAFERNSLVFVSSQRDPMEEDVDIENIYSMGVVCKINESVKLPDDSYRVIIEGLDRGQIKNSKEENGYIEVEIDRYLYEADEDNNDLEALKRTAIEYFEKYMSFKKDIPQELLLNIKFEQDYSKLADSLISYLDPNPALVQEVLEELDVNKRFIKVLNVLSKEIDILTLKADLNSQVNIRLNKSQREYFLREQLNVIKEELEETEAGGKTYQEKYKEDIENLPIEKEYKTHLLKELDRLDYISGASPESNLIRTYLENIFEIPFGKYSEDDIDINKSREILDKDHYGMEDVKERILEFLAVRKLKGDMKGSILCLVGPPGVGKTSIVKAVAESMSREYVSMRLGGVSDESEIRGHRKTYIGAMPGRIITSLQRISTLNPVFLLDEIDKLSSDYRADPSSALLEVLDPNQNDKFLDRYIEIPVDLSKVMFVTTANDVSTIPRPLLDRMEIIELSGYSEYDKFKIAKKFLLPKQLEAHGLESSQVKVSDSVLKVVIKNYTRESGVRNLERQLAKLSRKAAMEIIKGQEKVNISMRNYKDFLGREKYLDDEIVKSPEVGVVTGLAWTQVGGELLQIEVNTMKGKGKLQLTGSLGDVMKESAMAALSYIRANQEKFSLDSKVFEERDIHVHVPEGATPKDGPSAGITMTTGIVSALTNKKIRQDIAMTGEVTIRGKVLPIGGLKEKALAALRYGIKNIIIPKQNEKDLEDIPEEARKEIIFYPVKEVEEVLELAILEGEDHED